MNQLMTEHLSRSEGVCLHERVDGRHVYGLFMGLVGQLLLCGELGTVVQHM